MTDYQTWMGKTVYDNDDHKIGSIANLYYEEDANKPDWATIHSGLFGNKVHFVPLQGATERDGDVRVTVSQERIKNAPSLTDGAELSVEEEDSLYKHYGMAPSGDRAGDDKHDDDNRGRDGRNDIHGDERRSDRTGDTSGRDSVTDRPLSADGSGRQTDATSVGANRAGSDQPDGANTTSQPTGPVTIGQHPVTGRRVRLQKYIVTEMVQTTVPIQREETRVVGEPIRGDSVASGDSGSDTVR